MHKQPLDYEQIGLILMLLMLPLSICRAQGTPFKQSIESVIAAKPAEPTTGTQPQLPFSFTYGDARSCDILPTWPREVKSSEEESGKRSIVTWDDPKTGLRVEWSVLAYHDSDAVEMRLLFEQKGPADSEIITQSRPLNQNIEGKDFDVIYAHGGRFYFNDDFQPFVKHLRGDLPPVHLSAKDGFSSNEELPFWLVVSPGGEGYYYGLGWTGQWVADLKTTGTAITVEAGMENLKLRLHPGERISQPSVLLGHFSGGRWAGHNALRRILYNHYTANLNGHKPEAPISWNHFFVWGNQISEQPMIEMTKALKPLGVEYFCIDAGWFGEYPLIGDWRVLKTKFPNGLEPVAEAVKQNGMKMGLWFEPERVTSQAAYDAFPRKDLLLATKPGAACQGIDGWLVDLSRPEAQQWTVDLIGGYVKKLDLKWIRWDFFAKLLDKWNAPAETEPDRLGMKEIRYIEGLYQVLDTLNHDYPDLVIEWCAGGGRRIDLETIRRSHTFWKSDITGDGDVTRRHLTGGNMFLPGSYLNSNLIKIDSDYDYLCQMGGALGFGADFLKTSPEQNERTKRMIALSKELRPLLNKDYYPLFGYSDDPGPWDGWQFHDPVANEGFVVVLRPPSSPYPNAEIRLSGLDPSQHYQLVEPLSHAVEAKAVSGADLAKGYLVNLPQARSGLLIRYKAVAP